MNKKLKRKLKNPKYKQKFISAKRKEKKNRGRKGLGNSQNETCDLEY